jgi:hypothetical protein
MMRPGNTLVGWQRAERQLERRQRLLRQQVQRRQSQSQHPRPREVSTKTTPPKAGWQGI